VLSSKKLAVVIAAAVAVIVPIIMAAASPETLCSSDLSGMVNRNIKVDGPCAIDATVNGNIILDGSDDSIRLFNGTVDGNVEAKDSFRVEIGTGTEINGNLKLQNTTSTVIGEAIVRGNVEAIDGDLHVLPGAEIFGKVKHEGSGVCVVAPDAKVHGGIEGCLTSDGT
jgi:cytoskeletal protein CcmA (bactofilin family)